MKKFILGLALAIFAPIALAGPYIPLQEAHTGVWGPAESVGEGIDIFVLAHPVDPNRGFMFANLYWIDDNGRHWASAGGFIDESYNPDLGMYEFLVFVRDEPNDEAYVIGSLWLKTSVSGVEWKVLISNPETYREGRLEQVIKVSNERIGRCGPAISFPAPAPANPIYCN